MSIQAQLNKESLEYLQKIKQLIKNAGDFEANQMRCKALGAMMNSRKAIVDMTEKELSNFEDRLIEYFKEAKWIE